MATFPGSGALRTNVNTKYRKALVQREMYRMIYQCVVFGPKVTFRFRRPLGGSWAQPELLVPVLGLQAELALSEPILSAPSDGGGHLYLASEASRPQRMTSGASQLRSHA